MRVGVKNAVTTSKEMRTMETHLSRFLNGAFQKWQDAQIGFVVLRNYESLPNRVAGDIDVLIEQGKLVAAEQLLIEAALDAGYRLHNRVELVPVALFFFHPDTCDQVRLDLSSFLKWRGVDLAVSMKILADRIAHRNFFIPGPVDEAMVSLLTHLLFQGCVKDKYKPAIFESFRSDRKRALTLLTERFGRLCAAELMAAILSGNWPVADALTNRLRFALMRRELSQRPIRTAKAWLSDTRRLLRRWLWPPGLVVTLLGPDGSGKSIVATMLIDKLSSTFATQKGLKVHWKPPRFFRHRSGTRDPAMSSDGQRLWGRFVSFPFFAYCWFNFFPRAWLQSRRIAFKSGLVVIDQYCYDFFVSPSHYGLQVSPIVVAWGYRLLPKPDLLFLLDAFPDTLQARQQEVLWSEPARQHGCFRTLIQRLKQGRIVDATADPEEVANRMVRDTLEFLAQRTEKRRGSLCLVS